MGDKPLTGPYARLRDEIVEFVESELEWMPDEAPGDSPIEKLFYVALVSYCRFGGGPLHRIASPSKDCPLDYMLAQEDPGRIIIVPQAQLDGWRVDFLIYAWEFGSVSGRAQWRRLIVECDGHNFHERTKEQAAKDRGRDREFQMRGYTILRFTGSELHANLLKCAGEVGDWIQMGW